MPRANLGPETSLRFPPVRNTGQERAKAEPGREKIWKKVDEEEAFCHPPRAEEEWTLLPPLDTTEPKKVCSTSQKRLAEASGRD